MVTQVRVGRPVGGRCLVSQGGVQQNDCPPAGQLAMDRVVELVDHINQVSSALEKTRVNETS